MKHYLKKMRIVVSTLTLLSFYTASLNAYVLQGPHILELMTAKYGKAKRLLVSQKLILFKNDTQQGEFELIDITGGAPELHPDLEIFIRALSPLASKTVLRSNLTALYQKGPPLMNLLKECNIDIVASFPSLVTPPKVTV